MSDEHDRSVILVDESIKETRGCRHFNGVQHKRCKADVAYADVTVMHEPIPFRWARDGIPTSVVLNQSRSWPCLAGPNLGHASCPRFEAVTDEDIAARKARTDRTMDLLARGLSSCCEAPIDESHVIREGRYKGHGPRYCSKCGKVAFIV